MERSTTIKPETSDKTVENKVLQALRGYFAKKFENKDPTIEDGGDFGALWQLD